MKAGASGEALRNAQIASIAVLSHLNVEQKILQPFDPISMISSLSRRASCDAIFSEKPSIVSVNKMFEAIKNLVQSQAHKAVENHVLRLFRIKADNSCFEQEISKKTSNDDDD